MTAGRPKTDINWHEFEKLCGLQCTLIEIASYFDCSEDTIERQCKQHYNKNFADVFDKKRGKGKISLRRKQWKLADNNVAMAIFLGKNFLDQSDKQEIKHSGDKENPVEHRLVIIRADKKGKNGNGKR